MQPSEQERDFTDSYRFVSPLFFVVIGFGMGVLATILAMSRNFLSRDFLDDFAPEALGIVITVGVIDRLNRYVIRNEYKKNLIRQMKSNSRDFVHEAVRQLTDEGWLQDGSLRGAILGKANLNGVDLSHANLQRTYLRQVNLCETVLYQANLEGADLSFSYLPLQDTGDEELFRDKNKGPYFLEANLKNATLEGVILKGANFQKAFLQGATLNRADLSNANLIDTNFREANLSGAILEGARLKGADFSGANLINITLLNTDLDHTTIFDKDTILPDSLGKYLDPNDPAHKHWTSDTDMTRYTNPYHPDFWEPK